MYSREKPITYVGEVGLKVLDINGMVEFYCDIIGFEVLEKSVDSAVLGAGGKSLLRLEGVDGLQEKDERYAGLYHFGACGRRKAAAHCGTASRAWRRS